MKLLREFIHRIVNITARFHLRSIKAALYFKSSSQRLGKGVKIHGWTDHLKLGHTNNFYDRCIFHFNRKSHFVTGHHVTLSYNVLVSCENRIQIGDYVQIGEFTSLRDSTHDYSVSGNIMGSPDINSEINIGNNVWIGRGCMIMPGTIIEDGVVVGANSVVKGRLVKDTVYAGSPARPIKSRISATDEHRE